MPKPQLDLRGTSSQADETLEGVLEKVVFANPENGWSVLKLSVPGKRGAVTAVGNVAGVQPGENLRLAGHWEEDRKWGKRFRASSFRTVRPATAEGIERYLGSGLIRGIGKKMAERLVEAFGVGTLEVIESHPERLRQVEGIGPKRSRQILEAWEEQRHIQRVMVFLQSHGISTGHAVRIFKTYGAEAEERVTENPYRLAEDIFGIGFKSADQIAEHLGISRDSPRRVEAGILHVLRQAADNGHVYLPHGKLLAATVELLEIDETLIDEGIRSLVSEQRLIAEEVDDSAEAAFFTPALHDAEVELAAALGALLGASSKLPEIEAPRAIEWFEAREDLELAGQQREAITQGLARPVLVITGGPGTGKTTLLRGLVEILQAKKARILLAAPTGRAARRLAEATGRDARTVHRLLEFDPRSRTFARGLDLPLDGDLVIVDEASMLDLALARSLVEAVPPGA
ncbi:MAG: AAA family ATPase, partial [Acidobacteria bacterium]|nr:AAA family ATPase [Acidobacteriota bacterium]